MENLTEAERKISNLGYKEREGGQHHSHWKLFNEYEWIKKSSKQKKVTFL